MRVKAKRIDVASQEYLNLDHKIKTKGQRPILQVRRLISNARSTKRGDLAGFRLAMETPPTSLCATWRIAWRTLCSLPPMVTTPFGTRSAGRLTPGKSLRLTIAHLCKIYGTDPNPKTPSSRYSPPECVGVKCETYSGDPRPQTHLHQLR